jgi:hypothetical protein
MKGSNNSSPTWPGSPRPDERAEASIVEATGTLGLDKQGFLRLLVDDVRKVEK